MENVCLGVNFLVCSRPWRDCSEYKKIMFQECSKKLNLHLMELNSSMTVELFQTLNSNKRERRRVIMEYHQ
jgi:hypothetical protein